MNNTWEQECLTSYVNFIAENVGISATDLIRGLIVPLASGVNNRDCNVWRRIDRGEGRGANWLAVLAELTGRNDLAGLTFLPLSAVCSVNAELRQHSAFCARCLEEQADRGDSAYTPLMWRLRSYSVCIKHHILMQNSCKYCGCDKLRIFFAGGRNGCCYRCGRWLGNARAANELGRYSLKQLSISVCAAELLSLAQRGEQAIRPVKSFMAEVVDQRLDGNASSLARGLGVSRVQARLYVLCEDLPQIQDWACISEIADISLLELLPHRPLPRNLGEHPWFAESARLLTRKVHPKEKLTATTASTVLRKALDAQVAVSLTQLAASIGTKYYRLQRLAPKLAADVSKRYRLSAIANVRTRHAKFRKDLSRAVDNILLTGNFPTPTRVSKYTGVNVGWPGLYQNAYLAEMRKRNLVNGK